jgi:hypothetical protein
MKEEKMAEYKKKHCCYCFESFIKNKCLLCTYITMILISLTITTIISMAVMALILMAYGNKQEEICQPIQMKMENYSPSRKEVTNCITK